MTLTVNSDRPAGAEEPLDLPSKEDDLIFKGSLAPTMGVLVAPKLFGLIAALLGAEVYSWLATQWRTAPRKLPRCISPVGWIPEKTRAIPGHASGEVRGEGAGILLSEMGYEHDRSEPVIRLWDETHHDCCVARQHARERKTA